MNKKYMDFVPAASKSGTRAKVTRPVTVTRQKPIVQRSSAEKPVQKSTPVKRTVSRSANPAPEVKTSEFSIKKELEYGVIEDFRPKFVKTEVEKRPLSRGHFATQESELSRIKGQNLKNTSVKAVENHVEKPVEKSVKNKTLKLPKSPFLTQAKVAKRPLSKNVYEKKIAPTKETAKGPVTIIDKPEKESKLSILITIIITVILGAVAGAIAFLLLPK